MAWEEWFDSIRESLTEFGVKVEKDYLRTICTGFFSKPEPPMDGAKELTLSLLRKVKIHSDEVQVGVSLRSKSKSYLI